MWSDKSESKKVVCPHCTAKLHVQRTRTRTFNAEEYLCIVTTIGGFQVVRYIYLSVRKKVGQPAYTFSREVLQRWIAPNGKKAVVARLRPTCCWYDTWQFTSELELRNDNGHYNIQPTKVYPRMSVLPQIKRNGFKGDFNHISPARLFELLLTSNRAETLLKTGYFNLLRRIAYAGVTSIDKHWNSIRIAIRNGYQIDDANLWCDYIDLLSAMGKDTSSPKYVCPADLTAEHDRYVQLNLARREREQIAQKRAKAIEDEERFKELKAKFFGIAFTDGTIEVKLLESVAEHLEEGTAMHHCVFSNRYYLKESSLIFSAKIGGKRIETVEVSLETMQVVQSRGVCNKNTEHHDQIVNLVNNNIQSIQKRLTA